MNLRMALCVCVALTLAACSSNSDPQGGRRTGSLPSTGAASADTDLPSTGAASADTDLPSTGAASAACGDKITPDAAAARILPSGFPTVAGWSATEAVRQGKTLVLRGAVGGDPPDIVDVRDAAIAKLTAVGYVRTGGDQEPGFEADADFTGSYPGNINVRALCRDYLVVTYTFAQ
jgi:hypothetical protein